MWDRQRWGGEGGAYGGALLLGSLWLQTPHSVGLHGTPLCAHLGGHGGGGPPSAPPPPQQPGVQKGVLLRAEGTPPLGWGWVHCTEGGGGGGDPSVSPALLALPLCCMHGSLQLLRCDEAVLMLIAMVLIALLVPCPHPALRWGGAACFT